MEDENSSPGPESEPDNFSIPNLIDIAVNNLEDLTNFRQEVLKSYIALKNSQKWVNGYMAAKMLSVTDRTLRRYRIKYNIRIKFINGICRYYYPDLLALLNEPSKTTDEKNENHYARQTRK